MIVVISFKLKEEKTRKKEREVKLVYDSKVQNLATTLKRASPKGKYRVHDIF